MAVDSVNNDGLTIDEKVFTLHFYTAEANFLCGYLNNLTRWVNQFILNIVESWRFCRPWGNSWYPDFEFKGARNDRLGCKPGFIVGFRNIAIPESSMEIIISSFLLNCGLLSPLWRFTLNHGSRDIGALDTQHTNTKFVIKDACFIDGMDMCSHSKRSHFIVLLKPRCCIESFDKNILGCE